MKYSPFKILDRVWYGNTPAYGYSKINWEICFTQGDHGHEIRNTAQIQIKKRIISNRSRTRALTVIKRTQFMSGLKLWPKKLKQCSVIPSFNHDIYMRLRRLIKVRAQKQPLPWLKIWKGLTCHSNGRAEGLKNMGHTRSEQPDLKNKKIISTNNKKSLNCPFYSIW